MLTAAPQIYVLCIQNLWLALISFVDALPSLEEPFVIDWLTHSLTDWWFLKSPYLSLLFGLAVIWSSTIQPLINWSIHQFIHKCAAMCKILTYFVNFKQSETKDMLGRIQTFHKWSWKFCSLAVTEGFWRFPWHLCRDISKSSRTEKGFSSWGSRYLKSPHLCQSHLSNVSRHLSNDSDIYQIFLIAHLRPDFQGCWKYFDVNCVRFHNCLIPLEPGT